MNLISFLTYLNLFESKNSDVDVIVVVLIINVK
jgi:hypothetical protein